MSTSIPVGYANSFLNKFFLSHILLVLFILYYLILNAESLKRLNLDLSGKIFFGFLFSYIAWLFIASLTSFLPSRLPSIFAWLKNYLIPSLVLIPLFMEGSKGRNILLNAFRNGIVYSGVVFSIFAILEYRFPFFMKKYILGEVRWNESLYHYFNNFSLNAAAGLFEHFSSFAVTQALAIILLLPGFDLLTRKFIRKVNKENRARFFYKYFSGHAILFIIFISGIAHSTSKTALLTLIFGILVFVLIFRKGASLFTKKFIFSIGLLLLITAVLFSINPESRKRILFIFSTEPSATSDSLSSKAKSIILRSLNGRDYYYKQAWGFIRENPIKGIGVFQMSQAMTVYAESYSMKDYDRDFPDNSSSAPYFGTPELRKLGFGYQKDWYRSQIAIHPHNLFLNVLLEGGFIALILFLGILFIVFYNKNVDRKYLSMVSLLLAFLFSQITELFLTNSLWHSTFFFLILSLTFISKKTYQANLR